MPRGSSIWGYKVIKSTVAETPGATMGSRSFLYRDGDLVADDEKVIDFASALKMHDYTGGWGRQGEDVWIQEPGGQPLSDDQVDVILASGAEYSLNS
jgi:hypothetical protein